MPRPKNELLLCFFEKKENGNVMCKNGQCKNKQRALTEHSPNLERHLRQTHPNEFERYEAKKGGYSCKRTSV